MAQGWILAPYCDFTPDAACDLADINQMFETGDLVTGVLFAGSTDRYDLSDNDTIDAADISEWLSQAATKNGYSSAYLRGDGNLDRDVDLSDYNTLAGSFNPLGYAAAAAVPEPVSLVLLSLGGLLVLFRRPGGH